MGERLPNVFADGEMTLWFHVPCAAWRRPEAFAEVTQEGLPTAAEDEDDPIDWTALREIAAVGVEHPRLQRIASAERAKTGRASCRHCRESIAKDSLRIALQYFEDARFVPSGFLHPACAIDYVGTPRAREAVARARTALSEEEQAELVASVSAT